MKWKLSGSILVGAAASLAVLHGCSSDDDASGTANTGGGAGFGGAGTGASSSTGASASTGGTTGGADAGGQGGMGGSGPQPDMICEPEQGQGGNAPAPRCEVFPAACGEVEDYEDGAVFGMSGVDQLIEQWNSPHQVIFTLEGNDNLSGYSSGACLVGGEGNDEIYFSNEASVPRSNIGVGGPGQDIWLMSTPNQSAPAVIADIESNEQIHFENVGLDDEAAGDTFVEFIDNFGGANAEITKTTTRAVYDPQSGKIWTDDDGSGAEYAPRLVATVANAHEVTLTVDNFVGPWDGL